jgi:nicotinamide-nucleotide amidase
MFAEILTIGDELCRGEIVDTNSSGLAARLWDLQITPRWMTSCRDNDDDMRAALRLAVQRADLVICSGGLGPTEDDLTVDVVAGMVGKGIHIDAEAQANWEARVAGRLPMTELFLRQLRVPDGANVWSNPAGAAPGFEVVLDGVPVICLPGVPREVWGIYEKHLAQRFTEMRAARGDAPCMARRIYRVFGRGESQISEKCRGLVDGVAGASIHYQVKYPETLVKLVVSRSNQAEAETTLDELEVGLRSRLGEWLYTVGLEALPERVCRKLRATKLRVATAESCTGGLLAELLTGPAGASSYFIGAAVCYSNEEKTRALGVPAHIFVDDGAVSQACVRAMALGALERLNVDLAVAISGVAGPTGGTESKPVGTVHLAIAVRKPGFSVADADVAFKTYSLGFARDMIRTLAAWWGLWLIDRAIAER